jgi:hypothetical protein
MVEKRLSGGVGYAVCAMVLLLASQPCSSTSISSYPDLAGPVWTNGEFQLTLNGAEGVPYVIESSPDLVNWTPVVTNSDFSDVRLISLAAPDDANFYRSMRASGPVPAAVAVAAAGNITLGGSGIITDSYNSHDPNLSTGGQYDSSKTSTNGNVASESGVVNLNNHAVTGNLYLGSSASNTANGFVTGTIYTNFNVQFPDVTLPSGASSWPIAVLTSTNIIIKGASKTVYYYDFTNSGNYILTSDAYPIYVEPEVIVTLNVTSTTFAPTELVIHGGTTNSGTAYFYLNGSTSADLPANMATDASNMPENLWYFGMPTLTSFTFAFGISTNFAGVIYAPEAALTLNGGGSGYNVIGSVVVNSIAVNGHYAFHYDEFLVNFWPYF